MPRVTSTVTQEATVAGDRYLVIGCAVPRPAALLELTPAELAVADAWVAGGSMRDIATSRGAAVRTIANQLASLYRKLGVGSRAELQRRLRAEEGPEP